MSKGVSLLTVCILAAGIRQFTIVSGFNLVILHTNDVHSRVEQFNEFGSDCSQKAAADGECYGGVARRDTKIKKIRNGTDNVVLLDAGDQFLGSLWFNLYKGKASAVFMERLAYDVMCLGNHEFDLGDQAIADFIDNVTFPVVSANTEATSSSPLHGKFTKSVTLTVGGEKIGIVGYTTEETSMISNPSKNVRFHDVIVSVSDEVRSLTDQGVNKVIALGHAGFNVDLKVAEIPDVDIVVGGHSNTFLYNGEPPSVESPSGPYPTVVTQASGKRALVVQDAAWGKYLGYLNITFDNMGVVESWTGNPIILDNTVVEDAGTRALVDEMGTAVKAQNAKVVGSSKVFLNGRREICRTQECNMANLFLDSVIDYHLNFSHPNTSWAPASIAMWNSGGIRASIQKGDVTIGSVITVLPFNNEVDLLRIRGSDLRRQLEHSVRGLDPQQPGGKFLQFSGLRIVYDSRPVQQRVLSVEVRCLECDIPSYSPLNDATEYNILTNSFMANGGDGYSFQPIQRVRFNSLESNVLTNYFQRHSPVYATVEGRIKFSNPDDVSSAPGSVSSSYTLLLLALLFQFLVYIRQ